MPVSAVLTGMTSDKRLLRKGDGPSLRSFAECVTRLASTVGTAVIVQWGGAEHNMPRTSDERWTVNALANYAVDYGARCSARTGKARELDFFRAYSRPPSRMVNEVFLTASGAVVLDDPCEHVRCHASWLCPRFLLT